MPNEFQPLVNGASYSGTTVTVNILGVSLSGLRKVDFGDGQKKENIYGTGTKVNSRSYGREEPDGSITVLFSDLLALQDAAPDKKIHKIPPFDVTIAYVESGKTVVFVLEQTEFTKYKVSHSTDDMKIEVELPLIIGEVTRKR
jgi:hypothetical protein